MTGLEAKNKGADTEFDEALLRALVACPKEATEVLYDALSSDSRIVPVYSRNDYLPKSKAFYDHWEQINFRAQTGPVTSERVGVYLSEIIGIKCAGLDPESEAREIEFLNRLGRQVLSIVYGSRQRYSQ